MLTSPLHSDHLARGAKFAEFGGWNMPLQYASALEEHGAVRASCGAFDVSHLGVVSVEGANAFATLDQVFTNDLRRIAPGRTQYTHLLNGNGGVVDDCILWWCSETHFLVIPNASNTGPIEDALHGAANGHSDVSIRTWPGSDRVMIAVQGPTARTSVAAVLPPEAAEVPRFAVVECESPFGHVIVAGTGYTGEDGIEILAPSQQGSALWEALIAAGAQPVGLAARDSLRLEAGLPLHGHELTESITSAEANLGWAVRPDGRTFPGVTAVLEERNHGRKRRLIGLSAGTRQFPRQGYEVRLGEHVIGEVTSGNFSPILGRGIAFALVSGDPEQGTEVVVNVRGKSLPMTVTAVPFVPHRKRLT